MQKERIINRIPSPTFRWLKLNGTKIRLDIASAGSYTGLELPSSIRESESIGFPEDGAFADLPSGLGRELGDILSVTDAKVPIYETDQELEDPLRLSFHYKGVVSEAYGACLSVGAGGSLVAVCDFTSEEGAAGSAAALTRYRVEAGGSLTLVQICRLSQGMTLLSDVGGVCAEDGTFRLIQLVFGDGEVFLGAALRLLGKRAHLHTDLGYLLSGKGRLDINYVAEHLGKKTSCEINASGVLRDTASKLFRGTIDFRKGCAGAVGKENEEVLLLDEGVRNQTIPVILCAEEDVDGSHGASIGKLPEDLLFYLSSRGIDPAAIYEMMAKARIRAITNRIPDQKARQDLESWLGSGLDPDEGDARMVQV